MMSIHEMHMTGNMDTYIHARDNTQRDRHRGDIHAQLVKHNTTHRLRPWAIMPPDEELSAVAIQSPCACHARHTHVEMSENDMTSRGTDLLL